jgi:predicted DNA-binding transcriptional regulator YafY
VRYESWQGLRERLVEPLGLVLKAGAWYLVAQVGTPHGPHPRTYKVAKILSHRVQPETFERPDGFDLSAYWADAQRRFEAELRRHRARLRASPEGLKRLAALGAWARRAVADASPPEPDGWHMVELPVEGTDLAARQLLGLGPDVMVLAPGDLRARVAALARQVADLHRDDG